MARQQEDKMDAKQYSSLIDNIYSSGITMLVMGLGKRTGLFKALCESDKPLTSQEVADITHQKERYVREWLNGMVATRVIEVDRGSGRFFLTAVQRELLGRESLVSDLPFVFAAQEAALRECFSNDGPQGIAYDKQTPYFDWLRPYTTKMVDDIMATQLVPIFSSQGITPQLESGMTVVDVGCGEGSYTMGLASTFPNSTFTAVDISDYALEMARTKKAEKGLTNITFQSGDIERLPKVWAKSFDMVFMYDVLHDLPNPDKALEEIHRILKDDGYFVLMEIGSHADPVDNIGDPASAVNYGYSLFLCLPSSMSQPPYKGYGTCWGIENVEKALDVGKFEVRQKTVPDMGATESQAIYVCVKKA